MINRWLVTQCRCQTSLSDLDNTWKSFQLGSGLLFWEAAADLSDPLQADQRQDQDIVMDQFWFHFGTFELSFTVSDYSRINSLVMKFSPSYYCSQIIVLRHDIWMTFSSQVTEQSINFVTVSHNSSYFLICHEMLTVSESELNCFRSAALWQRWGALWQGREEGIWPGGTRGRGMMWHQ